MTTGSRAVFEPALARQAAWAAGVSLLYGALSGLFAARAWRVLQSARPSTAVVAA